ncbi:putative exostosin [Helianthus debilis subsp. tardiflorus]
MVESGGLRRWWCFEEVVAGDSFRRLGVVVSDEEEVKGIIRVTTDKEHECNFIKLRTKEYRTILKYRLMIPMYPEDETCPICRKACMDKYAEHAVHCKELPGIKYRHDWVRDVLGDILRRAGISAKKEAPVNFLTDPMEGRSNL